MILFRILGYKNWQISKFLSVDKSREYTGIQTYRYLPNMLIFQLTKSEHKFLSLTSWYK
jgi:hypothetical protein